MWCHLGASTGATARIDRIPDLTGNAERVFAQRNGIPMKMSQTSMENELKAAGDGAEGIVFVKNPPAWNPQTQTWDQKAGHAFGVRNEGGTIKYFDDQNGGMDGSVHFNGAADTYMYRTPGAKKP